MSEHEDEPTTGISDADLPEDLVPSEDNPLAEGLEDGETVDDLMESNESADDSEQDDSSDDAVDE